MTREELLEKICPTDNVNDCCSGDCMFGCDDCKVTMGYMLDEYDKQIRAEVIEECIKAINDLKIEFAYLHTICNVLEQLKEQK